MICKKGNKTNRTVMMENAVHDYFEKEFGIKMDSEVFVETGYADLCGVLHSVNNNPIDVVVCEIKQSIPDFYSGHGQNFVGSSNYVAVPSELVGFAICFLRNNKKEYVGVLEVLDSGFVRCITYPARHKNKWVHVGHFGSAFLLPVHLEKDLA